VSGVDVRGNYPRKGVPTTQSVLSDEQGSYAATSIPFGNRSITIDPKLVLAANTTSVSGNNNQTLNFTVNNFSSLNASIASATVTYNVSPPIYFGGVSLGNTNVFSSTTARLPSGSTVA